MKPLAHCRLYAFVDTAYLHGRDPAEVARQLCLGGADLIQLRAKQSSREEIRHMAESILPVTRSAGIGLVINDYPGLAREVGAELSHLGQEDFFKPGLTSVQQLAKIAGPVQIGFSTHAPEQALRAMAAGPAYIAIGPVYPTGTKPDVRPVTLEYVRWAAENVKIPWFAIGGITLENLSEVVVAGARRICAVSAILNAPDIAGACRQFRGRLPA